MTETPTKKGRPRFLSWQIMHVLPNSQAVRDPDIERLKIELDNNDIPQILHLQLKKYLYSYEFFLDNDSWRAPVHRYKPGKTMYIYFRQSDDMLVDSGWHRSFCSRHISEFIFTMKAYSHVDKINFSYYPDIRQSTLPKKKDQPLRASKTSKF